MTLAVTLLRLTLVAFTLLHASTAFLASPAGARSGTQQRHLALRGGAAAASADAAASESSELDLERLRREYERYQAAVEAPLHLLVTKVLMTPRRRSELQHISPTEL